MRGLRTKLTHQDEEKPNKVIGVFIATNFPEAEYDLIRETLAEGATRNPGALWVCAKTDKRSQGLFDELGLEWITLDLNPYWKVGDWDGRRQRRDIEMLRDCDLMLVFQKAGAAGWWTDKAKTKVEDRVHDNLYVIERGEKKKCRAPRRAPVAA